MKVAAKPKEIKRRFVDAAKCQSDHNTAREGGGPLHRPFPPSPNPRQPNLYVSLLTYWALLLPIYPLHVPLQSSAECHAGDLGLVTKGSLPPALEIVALALKENQVSQEICTEDGCYLLLRAS